jgi:hypothetical protein
MSLTVVLTNARVVTPTGVIDGSVAIEAGRISEIAERHYADGVDVHTDYLEKEIMPRPGAAVPLEMALHIMDLRAFGCGLTTVLSAARVSPERAGSAGSWHGDGLRRLAWWGWPHEHLTVAVPDFRSLPMQAFLEKYEAIIAATFT